MSFAFTAFLCVYAELTCSHAVIIKSPHFCISKGASRVYNLLGARNFLSRFVLVKWEEAKYSNWLLHKYDNDSHFIHSNSRRSLPHRMKDKKAKKCSFVKHLCFIQFRPLSCQQCSLASHHHQSSRSSRRVDGGGEECKESKQCHKSKFTAKTRQQ